MAYLRRIGLYAPTGADDTIGPVTTVKGCVQLFADEAGRLEKRINQFAPEAGYGSVVVDGSIDTTDAARIVDMLDHVMSVYGVNPKFPAGVTNLRQYVAGYQTKTLPGCSPAQTFVDDYFGDLDKAEAFHDIANKIAAGTIKRRPAQGGTLLIAGALALGGLWFLSRRSTS